MLKQDGMIMLSEKELETLVTKETEEKVKELKMRNELLRKAIMQLTTHKDINNKDVRVSKLDFMNMFDDALNEMFDNPNEEENDVYGYDVTVHWHGIYCNCGDGAVAYNNIVSAVKDCYEEDDEEYTED